MDTKNGPSIAIWRESMRCDVHWPSARFNTPRQCPKSAHRR